MAVIQRGLTTRVRTTRAAVKAVLYTVSGVLFAYGTFTIVTFGD